MEQYGIIGYPLGHSYSASYFSEKFKNEGINATYEKFEIEKIEKISEVITSHTNLRGFNVTSPYKEKIIEYLDELSPELRKIGACNVVKVTYRGVTPFLTGYNTDYLAFKQSIAPMLEEYHKGALILGTGGAAKAVNLALTELGLKTSFVSRFDRPGTVNYRHLHADDLKEFNVIINATPCGMFPNTAECPNIPYEGIDSHTLMYDLTYNPEKTLFLHKGEQRGAVIKNGLEMWLLQAHATWTVWSSNN